MEVKAKKLKMKKKDIMKQYRMLRTLVPTISFKKKVSKLEVIEETVRYIEELQNRLIDTIGEEEAQYKMAQTASLSLGPGVDQDENLPGQTNQLARDSQQGTTRRRNSLNSNLRQ